jgi:hypothetical protein
MVWLKFQHGEHLTFHPSTSTERETAIHQFLWSDIFHHLFQPSSFPVAQEHVRNLRILLSASGFDGVRNQFGLSLPRLWNAG